MVISQSAILCLHATVAQSASRVSTTGDRLSRFLPRPTRDHTIVQHPGPSTLRPDAEMVMALRAALHPKR